VRRWALLTLLVVGCSNLTEGPGGVVELEIRSPAASEVEVGETLQLTARALDRDGNPLDIPITWLSSDPALTVDNTGLVTAVVPGTAQLQASVGSLTSAQIPLTAIVRADTVALVGDSVIVVPADVSASAPLVVQLLSLSQPDPVPSRPVIYTVSFPLTVAGAPATLPGGVLVDTISTGTTGLDQSMTLSRVVGIPYADSAFVTVRSYRASGADVPGSGQRFIVLFQ
jgi:Bacterial Ig-like domain (group 2)